MSQTPRFTVHALARANHEESTLEVLGLYASHVDARDAMLAKIREYEDDATDPCFGVLTNYGEGVFTAADGLIEYQICELDVPAVTVALIETQND